MKSGFLVVVVLLVALSAIVEQWLRETNSNDDKEANITHSTSNKRELITDVCVCVLLETNRQRERERERENQIRLSIRRSILFAMSHFTVKREYRDKQPIKFLHAEREALVWELSD